MINQVYRQENPCPFTLKVQQGFMTVQHLGNLMVEKVRVLGCLCRFAGGDCSARWREEVRVEWNDRGAPSASLSRA